MSSLSHLRTGVRLALGRACPGLTTHLLCFGVPRGLFYGTAGRLLPGLRSRMVQARVPGSGAGLLVRLGTSDVEVFVQVYRWGEYEQDFAVAPRVIVDAGAYTGLSTAFFATRYPDAAIIAIEPDDGNFAMLARNTAGFPNVRLVQAALWSQSGTVSLEDPGDGAWGIRLAGVASPDAAVNAAHQGTGVRAVTVPEIMREHDLPGIDLLKVDIEGSEMEVFSHADTWIGSVNAISIELHDRFRPGCSSVFFQAVEDFPVRLQRGEDVFTARDESMLRRPPAPLPAV
jgi:FkbM family methyltransferase